MVLSLMTMTAAVVASVTACTVDASRTDMNTEPLIRERWAVTQTALVAKPFAVADVNAYIELFRHIKTKKCPSRIDANKPATLDVASELLATIELASPTVKLTD